MSRDVISDETWAVIGPLFPRPKATGRPPADRRQVLEAAAWHYRTGAPWREHAQALANSSGELDWRLLSTQQSCGCISTTRRCRGGLTTKSHPVRDGKGRALAFVLTALHRLNTGFNTTP